MSDPVFRARRLFCCLLLSIMFLAALSCGARASSAPQADPPAAAPRQETPSIIDLDSILYGSDQQTVDTEILAFLERWRKAWEGSAGPHGDLEGYIACYSEEGFSDRSFFAGQEAAGRFDRNSWLEEKRLRNRLKKWIRVRFSQVEISSSAHSAYAVVKFVQDYSSSDYADRTTKKLVLQKEESGWRIVAEQNL